MIRPKLPITIFRCTGTDVYGQPVFVSLGGDLVCPVKLIFSNVHTSVRTDSSATHGNAEETIANVVVLARPTAQINVDDMIVINGQKVRVTTKHARYNTRGALDHNELHGISWV